MDFLMDAGVQQLGGHHNDTFELGLQAVEGPL